jgi:hypothetical protein
VTSPTGSPSTRDTPVRTHDGPVEPPEADAPRKYAEAPAHARPMSRPVALIATIIVGILALGLCLLATVFGGVFGNPFAARSSASPTGPSTAAAQASAPVPPATSFGDGQWLVGTDILPGVYQVVVRADSTGCTWERDSSSDGTADSVLESGVGRPTQKLAVTIKDTDKVFHSQGCGTWHRIG